MSVGLVLSGGGLKGAYQAGAWKALCELGFDKEIRVISGCSIGVLNALLFISLPPEKIIDVWLSLKKKDVLEQNRHLENFSEIGNESNTIMDIVAILGIQAVNLFLFGAFNRKKHREILEKAVDWDNLERKGVKVFAACSRFVNPIKLEADYIELNFRDRVKAMQVTMASSALPVIFPVQLFNGSFYYDGGLTDNVPVRPLDNENCERIIIIHCQNKVEKNPRYIEYKNRRNITHVIPSQSLGGLLEFNIDVIKMNVEMGYRDMRKELTNGKLLIK